MTSTPTIPPSHRPTPRVSSPAFIVEQHPRTLGEVVPAFAELERGRSLALLPPVGQPVTSSSPPAMAEVWLGVTSSGSTGHPKLVWRRWSELKAAARRSDSVREWRWASPFDAWSFAGVQVALQAWINGGRAVSLRGDWPECWRTLTTERPDALSATPTFLDLLLQNEPAARVGWSPRQVTLGGEPLRAGLGHRLRVRWPDARFTAIYAAAEFGVLLKTQRVDGWYETASLAARWAGWRVQDGVLEVNENGTWRSTGDCVEVRGDLLRVLGRASEVANVAGTKVSLSQVSLLAEEVEGVARAVAVAEPNPVTGQVVALRYAPVLGADATVVQERLESRLRQALPKPAWPRRWVVAELGPDQNAKRGLR